MTRMQAARSRLSVSVADVSGVDRAGLFEVIRALDDSPAVGENGEPMSGQVASYEVAVGCHRPPHGEVAGDFLEVQGGAVLRCNLHGVSPAKPEGAGPQFSFQPLKLPSSATGALGVRAGGGIETL